jgi:ribosomal protein L11 methyltransferase
MKPGRLWRISVATRPEAEDVITDLLARLFACPASAYVDADTGHTTVAVYCDTKPSGLAAKRAALRSGLKHIRECGIQLGSGKISVTQIKREDWAESWKRHFKPLEISRTLLVKPSWSRRRPKRGQAVVVLDPGLSFGTGQHPTTSFCLRELVRGRRAELPQSFLDIGTGSGILAIAAAKLGYAPVHAFDFDPEAVRVACANAKVNREQNRVRIERKDVTKLSVRPALQYDVVCANLISTLLIAERRRIVRLLRPGGVLVLAGILRVEFGLVATAFKSLGLRLVASKADKEWRSGAFRVSDK